MAAEKADLVVRGEEADPALAGHVAVRGEELALGIERAAAFLLQQTSSRPSAALSRVYITGEGSRIPGLSAVLADRVHVPVTEAHPLERLDKAADAFGSLNVDEVAPLLMLPVGLALRAAA